MKRSLDMSPVEEFICDRPFLIGLVYKEQIDNRRTILNVLFKGKIFRPEYGHSHDEL